MGILDEAIRDHLELKRRRGGDPTEIERLEREALGPVRRVQESGEPMFEAGQPALAYEEPESVLASEDEAPIAEEWEYEPEEALLPGESWEPPKSVEAEHLVEEPPHEEPAAAAPPMERYEPEPPEPAASPPTAAATPPPTEASPAHEYEAGGETVEYDVEAEHEKAGGEDDVLEETPEFLQDAPEHDRLWFEQRPPKDFDFDG